MARSALIALPLTSLPSQTVSGDDPCGGVAEHVAERDDAAVAVGDLDADRALARDRREDPDLGRGERVGEVVLEVRDLRHLHAGRELELVAGDVRAGDRADDLRLDAEMAERLGEPAGGLLLAGGVGPHLLRGRALEDPRLGEGELLVGDRQLEVELLAPAGLRRGRRRGGPGRERRRGRDVQLGHRIGGGLLVQRLGLGLRPRRPGDRDLGRGAEEVRVAQHAVEGRARRARAHDRLLARRLGRPEERGLVRRRLGASRRPRRGGARGAGRGSSPRRGCASRSARPPPTRRSAAASRPRPGRSR